jgi:hypothetical protein
VRESALGAYPTIDETRVICLHTDPPQELVSFQRGLCFLHASLMLAMSAGNNRAPRPNCKHQRTLNRQVAWDTGCLQNNPAFLALDTSNGVRFLKTWPGAAITVAEAAKWGKNARGVRWVLGRTLLCWHKTPGMCYTGRHIYLQALQCINWIRPSKNCTWWLDLSYTTQCVCVPATIRYEHTTYMLLHTVTHYGDMLQLHANATALHTILQADTAIYMQNTLLHIHAALACTG